MLLLDGEHVTGTKERCNNLTMKYARVEWPREWRCFTASPNYLLILAYNRNLASLLALHESERARARVLYSHERV